MKLAYRAYAVTLLLLILAFAAAAQTPNVSGTSTVTYDKNARSAKDPRNTAPTVGTGGPIGGPTGLFTVYDGDTLRKGEWTLSAAWSNYDRDPGNVDFTNIPLSFQYGITNRIELFFTTTALKGVKVNSPQNLSSFYLPNSRLGTISPAAIILSPQGAGVSLFPNTAVFRPTLTAPFCTFPYTCGAGTFGIQLGTSGPIFGFPSGQALIGPPRVGGGGTSADVFPGLGSVYGSILPGVVLQTVTVDANGRAIGEAPTVFTLAPSYQPDAPFINRTWGTSSFDDFTGGVKWRFTSPSNPLGVGVIAYYRWWADNANDASGFNMMQRGAGPGGNRGDIGAVLFAGIRLKRWMNLSGNVGYNWNSSAKADFPTGTFTILDRPDELMASFGVDFPINKYVQPIFEFRSLRYVGGRTPNAFENHPMDAIAGIRIFPARWFGFGAAYRYHVNEQDQNSFKQDDSFSANTVIACSGAVVGQDTPTACAPTTITTTFSGMPPGFIPSEDPHGFILQVFAGRRHKRQAEVTNLPPNVTNLTVSDTDITLPCQPGFSSTSGGCNDSTSVQVTTTAVDPEGDVLTYNYTASAGRVVGTGATVSWDLSGVPVGSYTITAGVDDGCGICGKTMTQTVRVVDCPDCKQNCNCPTISVNGPAGVTNPGDSMTFTANVSGGSQDTAITYNWTVSAGTIESGQGTPSIVVRVPMENPPTNVTATLDIGGVQTSCGCVTNASETAGVSPLPVSTEVDTFGKLANDDVKVRVQNFYQQLANNPNAQGYIITYGNPKEIAARRKQITNAITFLQLDPSRVTFVDGGDRGTGVETHFFIVPPGARPPAPQ
jgi:hypothetical protein